MNETLRHILETRRGSGTHSESRFVAEYIQLALTLGAKFEFVDEGGNVCFSVGQGSETLFVAHADTICMATEGKNKLVEKEGFWTAENSTLGADDGVGIYIMLESMRNMLPGTYLLTRGEECGAVGSEHLVRTRADWLRRFKRSVCIDRRGVSEVIYVQGGSHCASYEFAEELSNALSNGNMLYAPSELGVFTDNLFYRDYIPENVNISAGYWNEHSQRETMLLSHVEELAVTIRQIDWENLPTVRDPRPVPNKMRRLADYMSEQPGELELLNDMYQALEDCIAGEDNDALFDLVVKRAYELGDFTKPRSTLDKNLLTASLAEDALMKSDPLQWLADELRLISKPVTVQGGMDGETVPS